MALAKCVFCGREEDDFKGVYLIKNEGLTVYFCSSKCFKNANKLKRDKKKVRWTEAHRITRNKRLNSVETVKPAVKKSKK